MYIFFYGIFTGKPYFVTSNNEIQYGIIHQIAVLTADIVTFENLLDAALFSDQMKILNYSSINQSSVIVKDTMYGNNIKVHGTRVMFQLFIQTADDFGQYTAVVNNSKGSSIYVISLKSASKYQLVFSRLCEFFVITFDFFHFVDCFLN